MIRPRRTQCLTPQSKAASPSRATAGELALICWGEGSPTVILETGGPNIDEWENTQLAPQLADRGRVCTYDRAGTGASDPAPNRKRDADDVIADLMTLLTAAQVDGPYVILGRSFRGMIATYFAQQVPDDIVGVVVLDTPAPSADFTEESEPELVWDNPGNTEHLDVVGGFENRFANEPPRIEVPLLLITPVPGEGTPKNESFWLQVSPDAEQAEVSCGEEPTQGACASKVVEFVQQVESNGD